MPTKQFDQDAEGDHKEAVSLADTLLKRIEEEQESTHESRTHEVETADLEATVDRFSQMFYFSQRFGEPIPCLDCGESGKAPIDFLPFPNWFGHPFRDYMASGEFHYLWRHWLRAYRYSSEEHSMRLLLAEPSEARSFFRDGLVKFLFSRFTGRRSSGGGTGGSGGGGGAPSKGIGFDVFTKKKGQRVHFTYSHLINTNPVFGAPTKHVSGYMKPGVWKFGVWQGGTVVLDPADFDVPAVNQAHLIV